VVSLTVFSVVFLLQSFINACAMAIAAKAVGSRRARLRYGLLCIALLIPPVLACEIMAMAVPRSDPYFRLFCVWNLLLVQICALYFLSKWIFRLSYLGTLAPVGASFAGSVITFILLLVLLKPYVVEAFILTTGSMSPTLDARDRFVVDKIISPQRWDIVAYRLATPNRLIVCKRLIAFPGEHLRFDNGTVYINDLPIPVPSVIAGRCQASPSPRVGKYQDGQTITLGPDDYFLIGDNLEYSADSRIYGPSSHSDLIGVVDLIYWPPTKMKILR
jgi:signal peptidase I